jgi:hypothetical protein
LGLLFRFPIPYSLFPGPWPLLLYFTAFFAATLTSRTGQVMAL